MENDENVRLLTQNAVLKEAATIVLDHRAQLTFKVDVESSKCVTNLLKYYLWNETNNSNSPFVTAALPILSALCASLRKLRFPNKN